MHTKLIGVTSRVSSANDNRTQFINERYLTPIIKKGFNTIILSLDNPNLEEILELCDGFVVAGGSDINPIYYQQVNNGESKDVDESIDKLDQAVVLHAVKNKKPLLGICRGHQAINVFLGGTLKQDIGTSHQNTTHDVNSSLNRYLKFPERFKTNSYHHQIIEKIADDLEIIAISDDGIIEAFIHKVLPIISFQWHPEKDIQDENNQLIFDKFAELVLEYEKR
ncbi:MAG TPA: type 1 glutamine amidotransferase [Acholeplasmataceae bacterium]|nr:type 1 glutamine amidotransferase [Acholeplasmataceae bacterium]